MPLSIQKFAAKTAHMTVVIDGEEVKLEYRPNKLTPQLFATMQELEDEVEIEDETTAAGLKKIARVVQDKIAEVFLAVIVAWDVIDEEKPAEPIPLTMEGLRSVPDLHYLELRLLKFLREDTSELGGGVAKKLNGHSPGIYGQRGR